MFLRKLLICIAILVCFSSFGEAIKCYNCQSDQTSECFEPQKHQNKFVIDCNTKTMSGYNPIMSLSPTKCTAYKRDGVQVRGCFWPKPEFPLLNICMQLPEDPNRLSDCTVCDNDLCNSAFSARATIGLVTIIMLIVGIFAY